MSPEQGECAKKGIFVPENLQKVEVKNSENMNDLKRSLGGKTESQTELNIFIPAI